MRCNDYGVGVRRPPLSSVRPTARLRPAAVGLASFWLLTSLLAGCTNPSPAPEVDRTGAPPSGTVDPPGEEALSPPATMPAFDDTSVAGSLVEGFPADVVPVPPDAQVLASSATDAEGSSLRQITLNLSSAATVQEVLDFYSGAMAGAGFTALAGSAPGGLSGQVAFNRSAADGPTETLFVGVLDTADARLVTVSGQVLPPAVS